MAASGLSRLLIAAALAAAVALPLAAGAEELDPAAWGSDHVGQPIPEYVTGDECLFCHRDDVGPSWSRNVHQRTMRAVDRESAAYRGLAEIAAVAPLLEEATIEMGKDEIVRYLKPNGRYGQLALLTAAWRLSGTDAEGESGGAAVGVESPAWDAGRFGERCAGCHATAVDSEARAFSSPALDCYTCHGAVDINHTADTSRILFAKGRRDEPRVVISICSSCHLRTGSSRSSGLPYPNNFVAGDNLFRDFAVDLSPEAAAALDPADRHVVENVRAVVRDGREGITCLTCHSVHGQSSERHAGLRPEPACYSCHTEDGPLEQVHPYERSSTLCEY